MNQTPYIYIYIYIYIYHLTILSLLHTLNPISNAIAIAIISPSHPQLDYGTICQVPTDHCNHHFL